MKDLTKKGRNLMMGAGYVNLRRKDKRKQMKVGRGKKEFNSNRPELAAFVLALRDIPVTTPMFYLCDNQALLKAVKQMDRQRLKQR